MTTPGLPPLHIVEPPGTPHPGGLYAAATLDDRSAPDRIAGGVLLEAADTGAHGQWPAACSTTTPAGEKGATEECPTLDAFPATVAWASDQRLMVGVTEDEARVAAAHTLLVTEQIEAEKHAAPQLVAKAGTPATAVGTGGDALVAALGAVEARLGKTGVIHAPRSVAALAASKNLIVDRSGKLLTPLGNRWAFYHGGSDTLTGLVIATGPVTVARGPVTTTTGPALTRNTRLVVSERHLVVAWTGPTIAAHL